MNQATLRKTLAAIDPGYKIHKAPDNITLIVLNRHITIGSGNALAMMTKDELLARIARATT